jgi:cytidylate kinase
VRGTDSAVVAIDGPSGSGKSTLAREVARRLGLRYLDTGAMYRAVTWAVLQAGADLGDAPAVAGVAASVHLEISTDADSESVSVDGVDVARAIRGPEVTDAVSVVSAVPAVRARLVDIQRRLIDGGGIVVEGRDIGTVVAPDATIKVFLTAATDARAGRRSRDLAAAGTRTDAQATAADLARRDALDSSRAVSPLSRAPDALALDSTDRTPEQLVDEIVTALRLTSSRAGAP